VTEGEKVQEMIVNGWAERLVSQDQNVCLLYTICQLYIHKSHFIYLLCNIDICDDKTYYLLIDCLAKPNWAFRSDYKLQPVNFLFIQQYDYGARATCTFTKRRFKEIFK